MLYRKAYDKLLEWKKNSNNKALCIFGARQIGKTTVIRQFGKTEYDCFVEINFVLNEKATRIFDDVSDVDSIVAGITALTGKALVPGKTLVLLDEVQNCPNARTAIKFLVEDGRFDYVESGSLLGVTQKYVKSLPVGFEENYHMYPMDFEEFLYANSVQKTTIELLRDCFKKKKMVPQTVHEKVLNLFYAYIIVGGMPEAVQEFVTSHDIGRVTAVQQSIIDLYRMDITQYADETDKVYIRAIYDAIPAQLNDKNRRFVLADIDKNGRQRRYASRFNWLVDAGVALACYNVEEPQAPLQLNQKHSIFKLFMADTGLLCAASMNGIQFDVLKGDVSVNMGSILENVMAQQFTSNGFELNYFDTRKYGELDFVLQEGAYVDFIEIKSGNDYKKHRALNNILKVTSWSRRRVMVFCKGNVEVTDDIVYMPLYMSMFLLVKHIDNGTVYIPDVTGL